MSINSEKVERGCENPECSWKGKLEESQLTLSQTDASTGEAEVLCLNCNLVKVAEQEG